MNPTLIVAIIGLLTTAAAPLLQTWLGTRYQQSAWTRDARIEVYCIALGYAEHLTGLVDNLTTPYSGTLNQVTISKESVSGRMRLLAPSNVVQAWSDLLEAEAILEWNLTEDGPAGLLIDPAVVVSENDKDLVRLKAAIDRLTTLIRSSFWSGNGRPERSPGWSSRWASKS